MCGYFCLGFAHFILAGKKLTDFTSLIFPYDFEKKMMVQVISKVNEIDKTQLTNQTKPRLNEILRLKILTKR